MRRKKQKAPDFSENIFFQKYSANFHFMQYLKPTHIFDGQKRWPAGHVLVCRDDGTIENIIPAAEAGNEVQELEGWLCPGLINAHCHLELSHMHGQIPRHTGLIAFIEQVMQHRNALHTEKETAATEAALQMWNNGINAVGDISNTTDSIRVKQQSRIHYVNFIEISGFVAGIAQARLDNGLYVEQEFIQAELDAFLVPHAPYSVSAALFEKIAALGQPLISIHNQETMDEDELLAFGSGDFRGFYERMGIRIDGFTPTGRSSFQSWQPYFAQSRKIAVHNTFISEEDLAFAGDDTWYCLCPQANRYIENRLPPVKRIMKHTGNICVGTDSLASNDTLDVLKELRMLQQADPTLATDVLLQWATANGAAALGLQQQYGHFKKGMKPGILLIDPEELSLLKRIQ